MVAMRERDTFSGDERLFLCQKNLSIPEKVLISHMAVRTLSLIVSAGAANLLLFLLLDRAELQTKESMRGLV